MPTGQFASKFIRPSYGTPGVLLPFVATLNTEIKLAFPVDSKWDVDGWVKVTAASGLTTLKAVTFKRHGDPTFPPISRLEATVAPPLQTFGEKFGAVLRPPPVLQPTDEPRTQAYSAEADPPSITNPGVACPTIALLQALASSTHFQLAVSELNISALPADSAIRAAKPCLLSIAKGQEPPAAQLKGLHAALRATTPEDDRQNPMDCAGLFLARLCIGLPQYASLYVPASASGGVFEQFWRASA